MPLIWVQGQTRFPETTMLNTSIKTRSKSQAVLFALTSLVVTQFATALLGESLLATGISEPISDLTLSVSVPGIVGARPFNEGDFVKEGEALLELDKRLEELEAQRRKIAMDHFKEDFDALDALVKKSSISVKKEEIRKAESDYKTAAVEFEMAAEQLRKRTILAPCAGQIAEITRDVGEACQPYQPLLRLVDVRRCYFVSNIDAKAAAGLKLDQTVTLEFESNGQTAAVKGRIQFLSPVVDAASGLQKVRVIFENAEGKVRPGITMRMRIG